MSDSSASSMSTPYLATKRRMIQVVTAPRSLPATQPAKFVRACLGNRYWCSTAERSDTCERPGEPGMRIGGAFYKGRHAPDVGSFPCMGPLVLTPAPQAPPPASVCLDAG